ncbi:hypothetical protein [Novosphingobium huizhouense]|uniref:hypothetical protein n=1 Tax=Novosphingobium huizhouense TaxID=2866625 RepID=UPI001CD895B5|nr:hypothetical protein [Novosphingobium huizhouense]
MKWVIRAYLLAYAIALGVFALSLVGPVSQRSAFGAIYLVALGLPWVAMTGAGDVTAGTGSLVVVLCPLVNLAVLVVLARWLRARSAVR